MGAAAFRRGGVSGVAERGLGQRLGGNWLTGKMAYDPVFRRDFLGCAESEAVAGFLHIGAETVAPPERPRPDVEELTRWL